MKDIFMDTAKVMSKGQVTIPNSKAFIEGNIEK